VKSVSDILTKKGVQSSIHKGKEANEESFKSLSEQHNDIIHIATHGFYLPTEKAEENDFLKLMPMFIPGSDAQSKSDPIKTSMLRSGLVFAGGNRAWKGEKITKDIDDGIATSAEIANISLAGTDLVVLSACETGLGEVNDEGVFGLQRAFKKAGVNSILMSMWNVDDLVTQSFMTEFYKGLATGLAKHQALAHAQQYVIQTYGDNPRYWAPFVLLD
jgi:CHAT domain-containing protein